MSETTRIKDLKTQAGKTVHLSGWVFNKRSSGKVKFLLLRDGSGILQCILVQNQVAPAVLELFEKLTLESSIHLSGKVREEKRAPGGVELDLEELSLVHLAEDYPIGKKEHGPDFLLSNRHLWLRSQRPHAILKVRDAFLRASREFFYQQGFIQVDPPIFTPSACEGTTTLFETEYFGEKAYLSQSGQLYGEAAALAFGKIYTLGPTFRAEKSKTRRHLTEFWMLEPEMAFCDLEEDMKVAEQYMEFTIQKVLKECASDLESLKRDTTKLQNVKAPFPRVSYDEAVDLLNKKGTPFEWGGDFGSPEETLLAESFDRPIFVHRFPAAIKAFYMKHDPQNPKLALGMDCLAPEGYGEIIGGGQREDDYSTLRSRLQEHGLKEEDFNWYLDLRKYGSVPHAGFGLGIERTVAWICGLDHLREASLFPRMISRLRP